MFALQNENALFVFFCGLSSSDSGPRPVKLVLDSSSSSHNAGPAVLPAAEGGEQNANSFDAGHVSDAKTSGLEGCNL